MPAFRKPARAAPGLLSATAAWKQIGKGDFNPGGDPTDHHQSGRGAQTAWAFDAHQGRSVLWNGTSHGGLWKSMVNSSGTPVGWDPLTDNFPGSHTLASFVLHRFDSDKILTSTGTTWGDGDGVYRSTDGGATWSGNTLLISPKQACRLAEDRSDPTGDTVFAGTSFAILRSHDFGLTWDRPLKGENITDLVQDAAGASGIFGGRRWTGGGTQAIIGTCR